MKRILSAIMLMISLLLTACNAAFGEPSGDGLNGIPSPESCATAMQYDTAYKRDITLVFDFGVKTGHYTGELVDGLPHGQWSDTIKVQSKNTLR